MSDEDLRYAPPEDGYSGGYIADLAGAIPGPLLVGADDDVRRAVRDWGIEHHLGQFRQTLDALAKHGVTWTTIPYRKMQLNGGGIHCSTTPLIRDSV